MPLVVTVECPCCGEFKIGINDMIDRQHMSLLIKVSKRELAPGRENSIFKQRLG
jgi:hypothetical protein